MSLSQGFLFWVLALHSDFGPTVISKTVVVPSQSESKLIPVVRVAGVS